jgi:histidinol-phosphatase
MRDTDLLSAVEEVARLGGGEALRRFRSGLAVEHKRDGSPVTEADRVAEARMREWIAERFPRDGIVGEETGETNPGAARRWLLDPVDGTKSFVRGVPEWGTLVAVADGNVVVAGAIFCPAASELVCAAPGLGCWHNGVRARVSSVDDLAQATVLTGKDCYGYLLVATGRAEVMSDANMSDWDSAALMPVIVEAGGVFTDWQGRATAFGKSGIATNAALASRARAQLWGET